jgi:hypothetical protein
VPSKDFDGVRLPIHTSWTDDGLSDNRPPVGCRRNDGVLLRLRTCRLSLSVGVNFMPCCSAVSCSDTAGLVARVFRPAARLLAERCRLSSRDYHVESFVSAVRLLTADIYTWRRYTPNKKRWKVRLREWIFRRLSAPIQSIWKWAGKWIIGEIYNRPTEETFTFAAWHVMICVYKKGELQKQLGLAPCRHTMQLVFSVSLHGELNLSVKSIESISCHWLIQYQHTLTGLHIHVVNLTLFF